MSFISEGIEKELRELRERLDTMEPGNKRSHVIGDFLSVLYHCLEEIEMNKMKIQKTILEWEALLVEEEVESEDFDFAESEEVSEEKSEWE
tara:strand:+ start:136 stop:408 length:273 start_codon:yes stop_codon:yes gene_type:complete